MTIKIETNVPVPRGTRSKYPFRYMEVGESFVIPKSKLSSVRTLAHRIKIKITTRQEGESYRIWLKEKAK